MFDDTRRPIWLEQDEYAGSMEEVVEESSLGSGAEALNDNQGNVLPSGWVLGAIRGCALPSLVPQLRASP